jgi:hypothetical protein
MSESRLRGSGGCRAVCMMFFGLNVLVGTLFVLLAPFISVFLVG